MDGFSSRIDAIAVDAIEERASAAGHSVEQEVAAVRRETRPLTVAEKLALSAMQRKLAGPAGGAEDSAAIIRRFRDTHGGRWTDADRR